MPSSNWNDPLVRASGEDSAPEEWLPKNDPKRIAWEKENFRQNKEKRIANLLKMVEEMDSEDVAQFLERVKKSDQSQQTGEDNS